MSRLREAFLWQSESCAAMGSPFMGQLMAVCAERWPTHGAVAERALQWPGDLSPKAESVPLRVAGGLHALVIKGDAPELTSVYPPQKVDDDVLWKAVSTALITHETFLLDWMKSPPQTNEVRRAAILIPVAHMLAARFGLALKLSELGASGGLNLNFDAFRLNVSGQTFGQESEVVLSPEWNGPCPEPTDLNVADRRGVDLNPLDPTTEADALRLTAYLWPDQAERLSRTRAAMALPRAVVDRGDAVDWLNTRLESNNGQAHMIYSTVAWQYFPKEKQAEGTALIEAAGARATEDAPLAWLTMEADEGECGAALTLRLWPGNLTLELARVDFHGRWVDWRGPATLP